MLLFLLFVRLDYLLELAKNTGEKLILIPISFVRDLSVTFEKSQVLLAVFTGLAETFAYDAQDLLLSLVFFELICKLCTLDEIFPGPARLLSLLRLHMVSTLRVINCALLHLVSGSLTHCRSSFWRHRHLRRLYRFHLGLTRRLHRHILLLFCVHVVL